MSQSLYLWTSGSKKNINDGTLFFYKGWTKISSTHHPLVLPNFYTLVSLIFFRQDTHPILFPYRYIYSGPYMKAHPLYLEKFEYSPSLIFPKFSVLIISSLIKASLTKKSLTSQVGIIFLAKSCVNLFHTLAVSASKCRT